MDAKHTKLENKSESEQNHAPWVQFGTDCPGNLGPGPGQGLKGMLGNCFPNWCTDGRVLLKAG